MKKKVLIIDDEPNIVKILMNYFQKNNLNFEILQAPNGKIAQKIAQTNIPDLIIMDWEMPVMNGIDATKALLENSKTKDIPIIFATGSMLEDKNLSQALDLGAIDYLRKPFNEVELIARVKSAIRLHDYLKLVNEQKKKIEALFQKEKEYAQQIIDQKNRELSTSTVQLANKNNILLTIDNLLKNDLNQDTKMDIIRLIKNNVRLDNQWEKFKLHFEEVHPDFFEKLENKFESLNERALRICAFIKMRLENNEIMNLLNLSPKGLETARYRIKKQMNLGRNQDLNEFIIGF